MGSASFQLVPSGILPEGSWRRSAACRRVENPSGKMPDGAGRMPALPGNVSRNGYSSPEIVLMVSARITVLKQNDNIPCTRANDRNPFAEICTSETCAVIPMTKEK